MKLGVKFVMPHSHSSLQHLFVPPPLSSTSSTSATLLTHRRQRKMDHSPLARLPAELRNIIYELVLVQDEPIEIGWKRYGKSTVRHMRATNYCKAGLLQTCREIYEDCKGFVYSCNSFKLADQNSLHEVAKELERFLLLIGQRNTALLKSMTLGEGWTLENSIYVFDDRHDLVRLLHVAKRYQILHRRLVVTFSFWLGGKKHLVELTLNEPQQALKHARQVVEEKIRDLPSADSACVDAQVIFSVLADWSKDVVEYSKQQSAKVEGGPKDVDGGEA